ncbi:NUDIX hydrolase [Mycobacterium sp.]|uniref:NUDIX hydrolase n=1 Tax=Mycobacterium sp. TaxID=1785 RepID=UPI003D6AA9E7
MSTQTSPHRPADRTVRAAGAVLWRPGPRDPAVEVALIHRPRYDDWSLPKGKVDPGETEPVTAVREVFEETGHGVHLGRRVTSVSYPIEQGTKKVRYWAARSLDGSFTPNHEVDDLIWLRVPAAIKQLSYPPDRKILRRFAKYPANSQTVLVVRHGTAGSKSRFKGDDAKRPLDKKGRAQAEALVGQLLAFGANDVYAADRVRCHQTVEPLAEELGVVIGNEPTLTEEAYAENPKHGRRRVLQIAGLLDDPARHPNTARSPMPPGQSIPPHVPVICTQGKVIPDLIGWWCERDGVRPDKSRNRKGSTWVLSLSDGRLVAADHIGSALADAAMT